MSKVILTQEQVEAIEIAIREYGKDDVLNDHLSAYPDYQNWGNNLEPLNGLEPHILARALYQPDGYEVEPEFKVGDWVVGEGHILAYKISKIKNDRIYFDYSTGNLRVEQVRHATPEEIKEEKRRRWWHDRDRGVWEVYEGDILMNNHGEHCLNVTDLILKRFGVLDYDQLDEFYKVACLAENREDAEE